MEIVEIIGLSGSLFAVVVIGGAVLSRMIKKAFLNLGKPMQTKKYLETLGIKNPKLSDFNTLSPEGMKNLIRFTVVNRVDLSKLFPSVASNNNEIAGLMAELQSTMAGLAGMQQLASSGGLDIPPQPQQPVTTVTPEQVQRLIEGEPEPEPEKKSLNPLKRKKKAVEVEPDVV